MVARRRKNLRRRARRAARRGGRRANQTTGALSKVKHYARITEAVNFTPMAPNTDYNYSFALNSFVRALAVSKNFKFYRAKRVVWTYLPDYNTFQSGVPAPSLPQVSMLMNRTGDNTLWTPAEYDAQGAVPKQFSKKIVIAYNPNIVQSIQYINQIVSGVPTQTFVGNVGARPVYNEWIATGNFNRTLTAPSQPGPGVAVVDLVEANNYMLYQGHSMYWEQTSTAPSEAPLGVVFCEVEWEFKDPLFQSPASGVNIASEQTLPA